MIDFEIEHERTGKPMRVLAMLSDIENVMRRISNMAARAAAERFLEGLQQNWAGQRAILWPLSQAYRESKQKKGLDDRILIATGELLSSLQINQTKSGVTVGPPPNTKHSQSDIALDTLLKIIEYGAPSRNLPPRAILRQTATAMREELIRLFKEEAKAMLKFELGI